jgi:hypothetical protein
MYAVYHTHQFDRSASKMLSSVEVTELDDFEDKLECNAFLGRPLYSDFLREKKVGGKRAYFLVYARLKLLLFVAVSTKKTQQATIENIKEQLSAYALYAQQLSERGGRDQL